MKGDGKGNISKRTPEDHGFQLDEGGLYVRSAKFGRALPVDVGVSAACPVEIGILGKPPGPPTLPAGVAELEVLCNRQTILGNPFSMLRGKGGGKQSDLPSAAVGSPDDDELRNTVCDLFADFLELALRADAGTPIKDIADAVVTKASVSKSMVGKDWARDFGHRRCEEYRRAFASLAILGCRHRRGIRLLCHCVPRRCHTQSLVARLVEDCSLSSATTYAETQPGDNAFHDLVTELHVTAAASSRASSSVAVASGGLSGSEKEVLKLAKKLREIAALEALGSSTLQKTQIDKISNKADIVVTFLSVVEALPRSSDVIVKVQDLISVVAPAQFQACVGVTCGPALEAPLQSTDEAGVQVVSTLIQEPPEEPMEASEVPREKRWRLRGGRSGFRRKYDADHA